jgi:hypothetical protein
LKGKHLGLVYRHRIVQLLEEQNRLYLFNL